MRCNPSQLATSALLIVVLSFSVCIWWSLRSIHADIHVITSQPSPAVMQTITQIVTNSSSQQITVTTTRLEGEDIGTWLQRHQEAVTAIEAS